MTGVLGAAGLVAAQRHGPGPTAHVVLLAAIAVIVLVALGVIRWRRRRGP